MLAGMSHTPPRQALHLRWVETTAEPRLRSWSAFDGPWEIGGVTDHRQSLASDTPPYRWGMTRLQSDTVAPNGYLQGRRAAAKAVEAAYFAALDSPSGIDGGIEEAVAFAAWKGIALPRQLLWSIARAEGRNPFPLRPHRAQLDAWAVEDRNRGGRGMLTPAIMADAFGPDWMERMHG